MSRRHREQTKSARKRAREAERARRQRILLGMRGPQQRAQAGPAPPAMTTAEKKADEQAGNRLFARHAPAPQATMAPSLKRR